MSWQKKCSETNPSQYEVLVGTSNLEDGGTSYKISNRISHEKYSSENRDNDIGLLKTSKKIEFTQQVWPIGLPNENPIFHPGLSVIAAGWGWTKVST